MERRAGRMGSAAGVTQPDKAVALRDSLPGLFASRDVYVEAFTVGSPEAFSAKLAPMITRLRGALVEADPPAKVYEPALTAAAEQEGISVASRPCVQGPGGVAA
jgi:hypothetical protein